MRRLLSRPVVTGVLVVAVLAVGTGLFWFQPWKVFQDETVREELPTAAGTPTAGSALSDTAPTPAKDTSETPVPQESQGPREVAVGKLISHEHRTSGAVKILRLPDGSHTLRLEGLETSNGPDLHVWITDAPVKEGRAGWGVFDDGKHKSLGKLKGNKGDQNYALPSDLDLARYTSVSIWCDRFDVSFGAAELAQV